MCIHPFYNASQLRIGLRKNMHLKLERLVWMDKYRCLTFQKQSLLGTRAEAIYLCVWLLPNTENTEASKRLREVVPKKGIMCIPFDPVPLLETYFITITACIQWHINKDVYCSIIWKIKTCKHECSTIKGILKSWYIHGFGIRTVFEYRFGILNATE